MEIFVKKFGNLGNFLKQILHINPIDLLFSPDTKLRTKNQVRNLYKEKNLSKQLGNLKHNNSN